MKETERHRHARLADGLDHLQSAELPEVLRLASEMYARDRAELERAAQRLELRKAAAEAGLPPEYLECAAHSLQTRRHQAAGRRRWRRVAAATAAGLALWVGALHLGSSTAPPPDAYLSYPGGSPYGGPGGYPGFYPPGAPGAPPGYGPPAAEAAPPGPPGGPVGYGGYPGPPGAPPDSRGGPLAGANLRGQAFPHANLSGQNLSQANLRGADMTSANLRGADLTGSDLRGADLTNADMSGVDLTDAVYDRFTRWPDGFDPAEHGAKPASQGVGE